MTSFPYSQMPQEWGSGSPTGSKGRRMATGNVLLETDPGSGEEVLRHGVGGIGSGRNDQPFLLLTLWKGLCGVH